MKTHRLFRILLRLLPFDFRLDYGDDIEQVFGDQRREARGRAARTRVWVRTAAGLARVGPREHLAQLRQDTAYAWRDMRHHPGFVAAVVLTLAVGIGINTAIFSVVHAALLRPLPYAQPDELVALWNHWTGSPTAPLSDPEYLDYSERSRTLSIAAATGAFVNLAGGTGDPDRVPAAYVTTNALEVLGVRPAFGRGFRAEEETRGHGEVAILTDGLWRSRFAADPHIAGRALIVDGAPHEILGVLSARTRLPLEFGTDMRVQIILPLPLDRMAPRDRRGGHYLQAFARLEPGASLRTAAAEMNTIVARLAREYPDQHDQGDFGILLRPLRQDRVGESKPVLLILAAAVGLVLLLACANVATLMLVRGESRRQELAVRMALGAGRLRMIRQLLTEACLLSLPGAAVGLLVARWCQAAVVSLAAGSALMPPAQEVTLSMPVLLFTAGLGLMTGVLFGVLPAVQLSRAAPGMMMKQGGAAGVGRVRTGVRRALVVVQVMMATVLLVGAGLLLKSFARVLSVPSGFNPEHVLTLRVSLPATRYPGLPEVSGFYARLLERVSAMPGVAGAGAATGLPLAVASGDWGFDIEGRPRVNGRRPGRAEWYVVTPGYFEALQIRLVRGRFPAASDDERAPAAVFINESAALRLFPGQDPIGRRVRLSNTTGPMQPWRTIAGIIGDVHQLSLERPAATEIYIPYRQFLHFSAGVQARAMVLVLRTATAPASIVPAVRAALRELDAGVAAADVRAMDTVVAESITDRRLSMLLIGAFALLAIVLAAIGMYGVMAHWVLQRTREMGLRIAVGAPQSSVRALVVGQGLRLAGTGLALGLGAALVLAGSIAPLLFEVSPRDAGVLAAVALALVAVAVLATWLPARRATRVDPVVALRAE